MNKKFHNIKTVQKKYNAVMILFMYIIKYNVQFLLKLNDFMHVHNYINNFAQP